MSSQYELPYQRHSSTSRDAAESMKEGASSIREKVFAFIQLNPDCSDDDIQVALGMSGSTQRPRRIELQAASRIVSCGTKKTRSGRTACTWRAK